MTPPDSGASRARRELVAAVLTCAATAGLVLWSAGRTWSVRHVPRPAPLPAQVVSDTGAHLTPVLPALAFVLLAAAVALPATRGRGRWLLGAALVAAGLAMIASTVATLVNRSPLILGWPVLCLFASAGAAVIGLMTVRRGRSWPAMGDRYARAGTRSVGPPSASSSSRTAAAMWDVIDQGNDPTVDSRRGPDVE